MNDPNWGEARVRARDERRARRTKWLTAAAVLLIVGVPFLTGLYDGLLNNPRTHMPIGASVAITAALAGLIAYAGWRNWSEADEVQRRVAAECFAGAGLVLLAGYPLTGLVAESAGYTIDTETAWWAGLAAAIAIWLFRRARG